MHLQKAMKITESSVMPPEANAYCDLAVGRLLHELPV
jgi:hypothetical protein